MGERHSDQYGCTKQLFTHAIQDLSKALLGASRNRNCWFVSYGCQLVCWFVNYDLYGRGVHATLRGLPRVAPC